MAHRTGMRARGLRGVRRMRHGATSTVYVLVKTTGGDSLSSVGSTESAGITSTDAGEIVLTICEDSALTVTQMERAAAFAIASPADETLRVWRQTAKVMPVGAADRTWSFTVSPTGVVFTPSSYFLLESGAPDQIAMEDSGLVVLEA